VIFSFLIFLPWADYGSLEELWTLGFTPRSPDLLLWALRQMTHLADGLRVLHQAGLEMSLEGTDPTTILRFRESKQAEGFGRLVIGGTAKSQKVYATRTGRRYPTRAPDERERSRYDAPDSDFKDSRGSMKPYRGQDVWSMGLTFLEFILWLLYGMDIVEDFRGVCKQMARNSYRGPLDTPSALSPELVEALKNKPQFSQGTAWHDLLSLLTGRVLVSMKDRCNAVELHAGMEKIMAVAEEDSAYFCVASSNPPKRLRDLTAGPRVDYLKVPTPAWKGELKF